jgi:hypothetical protein
MGYDLTVEQIIALVEQRVNCTFRRKMQRNGFRYQGMPLRISEHSQAIGVVAAPRQKLWYQSGQHWIEFDEPNSGA